MYNYELKHYGVKGMKWGVRRSIGKKARTYVTASQSAKATEKVVNRLEKKQKVYGQLNNRQQRKLDRNKTYLNNLKKAMNTLVKDISEKDIKQAKVDIIMRDFGSRLALGHIGGTIYNTKRYNDLYKLLSE